MLSQPSSDASEPSSSKSSYASSSSTSSSSVSFEAARASIAARAASISSRWCSIHVSSRFALATDLGSSSGRFRCDLPTRFASPAAPAACCITRWNSASPTTGSPATLRFRLYLCQSLR